MIKLIIYYTFITIQLLLSNGITLADEVKCADNDFRKQHCSLNEICINSLCKCKPGFARLNANCVKNSPINPIPSPAPYGPMTDSPDESNSHVAAAIIIPIMLILVVIGSVVLVRKYNVITWVQTKINQRQTPYDEVMIGQDDDDPPLAGV